MPTVTLPQVVWSWNAGHPSILVVSARKRLPTSARALYPPIPVAQATVLSLTRAASVARQNIERLAGASMANQADQAATIAALRRELSLIQARLLALENP